MTTGDRRVVVLVRHATAESGDGKPDHDRRLTGRGRRQAVATGEWLAGQIEEADEVWCSSATRARETWAGIEAAVPAGAVQVERAVYLASAQDVVDHVSSTRGTTVVVGHNPTIEGALATLTGQGRGMRPSAAAVVDLASGALLAFWDPPA